MLNHYQTIIARSYPRGAPFGNIPAGCLLAAIVVFGWSAAWCHRADGQDGAAVVAEALRELDADVLPESEQDDAREMLSRYLRQRLQEANRRGSAAWNRIDTREEWEAFAAPRLDALRHSLGTFPPPRNELNTRVTSEVRGDGFVIQNLVFESRPGLWVTANLYLPAEMAEPPAKMPGILLCHSHHTPKEHGELQDMGMTWARAGCAVLVMDHLGHGERRQHPFRTADDYAGDFRVSRQDYYFRYDTGIQLHLVGESLIGWMAWDLMRGVDLLLARPDVDPDRIILMGAVAGGGDPAAVTAALDERIAAAVPFNFGGPQPETQYPLPDNAETSFNYAGGGSWESTRNLRMSAADGFLPRVIVGGIAPRRLVYAHEFSWDRERDPVWRRLEQIYAFYDNRGGLAFTHGRGLLSGQPPEASHCTHIGREHRALIHEALAKWFDIRVSPQDEYSNRVPAERLLCMTAEVERDVQPLRLCDLLAEYSAAQTEALHEHLHQLTPDARRRQLQEQWRILVGNAVSGQSPSDVVEVESESLPSGVTLERLVLETEPGIRVPVLLLLPAESGETPRPVVVGVAQSGKSAFLRERAEEIGELLAGGAAVCLPDVRGTGETRAGDGRDRQSTDTSLSSTALMLGDTMVGERLRDMRSVLQYLHGRQDLDGGRIAVWGDSFAPTNLETAGDEAFHVPHGIGGRAPQSEPLGGLLALLCGLFNDDVAAIYVRGGLVGFQPVLTSQFVTIPHDVVIPGALTAGDLNEVAASLVPRPLCLVGLVDHHNVLVPSNRAQVAYSAATAAYRQAGRNDAIVIADDRPTPAGWLLAELAR